jgi:hypothetical protein
MAYNWPIGTGGKTEKKAARPVAEPEPERDGGEDHHGEIHAHLQSMHEQTGHAHSHVEHHGDGRHTSHHIDEHGEVSGPHDHENLEALKNHFDQFTNEEGKEGEGAKDDGWE